VIVSANKLHNISYPKIPHEFDDIYVTVCMIVPLY